MPDALAITCSYMPRIYDFPSILEQARTDLEHKDYDTLVGRGLSGAVVVPRLAESLGKHWLIVRKQGDASHSWYPAEGHIGKRWLFVDDFISTGDTFRLTYAGVLEAVSRIAVTWETECVGAWQYQREPGDMSMESLKRYLTDEQKAALGPPAPVPQVVECAERAEETGQPSVRAQWYFDPSSEAYTTISMDKDKMVSAIFDDYRSMPGKSMLDWKRNFRLYDDFKAPDFSSLLKPKVSDLT